jgi:hypothetical protein
LVQIGIGQRAAGDAIGVFAPATDQVATPATVAFSAFRRDAVCGNEDAHELLAEATNVQLKIPVLLN